MQLSRPTDPYDPRWLAWNAAHPNELRAVGADTPDPAPAPAPASAEGDPPAPVPAPAEGTEPPAATEPAPSPTESAPPDGGEEPGPTPPKGATPAWVQRRIDELTREKHEERRAREAVEAELALLQGMQEQEGGTPPADQPRPNVGGKRVFTEDEVRAEAARIAATDRFNADCTKIYETGKNNYPDFDTVVSGFRQLGGLPPTFIEAAMETGSPEAVLYELGKDLDEAQRIMSLPPIKQAVAMVKFASKIAPKPATKQVSKAPPPITPQVGHTGTASADLYDPNLSTREWMEARQKQIDARRQARA